MLVYMDADSNLNLDLFAEIFHIEIKYNKMFGLWDIADAMIGTFHACFGNDWSRQHSKIQNV